MNEFLGLKVVSEGVLIICPDCGELEFMSYDELDEIIQEGEYIDSEEELFVEDIIDDDIIEELFELKDKMALARENGDFETYRTIAEAYAILASI